MVCYQDSSISRLVGDLEFQSQAPGGHTTTTMEMGTSDSWTFVDR